MALHAAAVNGNKAVLRRLLQRAGTNANVVNSQDHDGRTPLVYSVLGGRQDCAELLLKAGASVSAADEYGMTALHYAANQGNHKCAKLLLSKGADWRVKNSEGRTPLHFAATQKSPKCLSLLLKRVPRGEADVEDIDCITPLHYSSACGNVEHVKLLLKAGASPKMTDNEKKTALHWASTNEHAGVVKLLLDQEPDVINSQDVEGRAAIHLAAAHKNSVVVKALVSTEKCLVSLMDNIGRSPLHWAAVVGNSQIVSQLLLKNADYKAADDNGATALHYAAQSNFAPTVEVMLSFDKMEDLRDKEGRTALMWAAGKGADRSLEKMLRHQLDVELVDNSGGTALHSAAYSGHVNCVQLLVQFGACVNTTDAVHQSPLFRACERGHAEVVNILLEHKANIYLDRDGRSPLHWAARGGHPLVCQILIEHGVPPDVKDNSRVTPLHCAAYSSSLNCVTLLIKHGADVKARDKNGNSALHWSCHSGHLEAAKLLVDTYTNFRELNSDRLTPLDFAILGDHQDVAKYMIEKGGLTIANMEDSAAEYIQNYWRSYQVRKSYQNRKNLLKRHAQLKDIKKRTGASEERKRRAETFSSSGNPPEVSTEVETAGSCDGRLTNGSEFDNELSPGGLGWERTMSESRPGYHSATNEQEATLSRSARLNSTEESSEGETNPDEPAYRPKYGSRTDEHNRFQHKAATGLEVSSEAVPTTYCRECIQYDNASGKQTDSTRKAKEDKNQRVSHIGTMDNFEKMSADFTTGRLQHEPNKIGERNVSGERTEIPTSPQSNLSHGNREFNSWSHSLDVAYSVNVARNRDTTAETTVADRAERARKERERLKLFRAKINAAVTIQRCFRRYSRNKHEFLQRQTDLASIYDESEELTQEVAALTIQLAWRKHRRECFEVKSKGKKANKKEWGCSAASVPLATRRIYGYSQDVRHCSRFRMQRVRKAASSKVAPSAASTSYNGALDLYHPLVSRQGNKRAAVVNSDARVRPHSMKRTAAGWTHDVKVTMEMNAGKRTRGGRK